LIRVIALIPNRFEINIRLTRRIAQKVPLDSERLKSCRIYSLPITVIAGSPKM
jgi:hypothetical protein